MAETTVKIKWYNNRIRTKATEANLRAMHAAAFMVEAEVKKNLSHAGTFNEYKKGKNRTIKHLSSKPGDYPALDTGILRAGISHEVFPSGTEIIGRITSAAPYSLHLELGTKFMEARPFLRPTIRANKQKIEAIFKRFNGGGV